MRIADVRLQCLQTWLYGFVRTFDILQHEQRWISDAAAIELESCRLSALQGYNALSGYSFSSVPTIVRFPLKPKHHMFSHCMQECISSRLNALSHLCFTDEDFIGRVKKVARICYLSNMGQAVLDKWTMRYFVSLSTAKSGI